MKEKLIPQQILFQDEYFVAINKPAGHMVHPADKPHPDDMVSMKIVRDQLSKMVYTIHRLDRPTCGVLLFGLDLEVSKKLHRLFENKQVQKIYWAVVEGWPEEDQWQERSPLQKTPDHPFQDAVTDFKVLKKEQINGVSLSLLECKPHTGRYHQIRKHLCGSGFPIVGDYRYAGIDRSNILSEILKLDTRMLLIAVSLEFQHPVSQQELRIEVANLLDVDSVQATIDLCLKSNISAPSDS